MVVNIGVSFDFLVRVLNIVRADLRVPQGIEKLPREQVVAVIIIGRGLEYGLGTGKAALWGSLIRLARQGDLAPSLFIDEGPSGAWRVLEEAGAPRTSDYSRRSRFLYDISFKTSKLYNGSFYSIITRSRGFLRRNSEGLIDRLEDFRVYRTPVHEKALRAALDLWKLGIFPLYDPWNTSIPVDSKLVGLAIRSCLIDIDSEILESIAARVPLDPWLDRTLRSFTMYAYDEVSRKSGLNPFHLYPRLEALSELCRPGTPEIRGECTRECMKLGLCDEKGCILRECCLASNPLVGVGDPQPPHKSFWD